MQPTDIVSSIYAHALTANGTNQLMAELGAMFDANASFMFSTHSASSPESVLISHNIASTTVDDFRAYWYKEDIWALEAGRRGLMKRNVVLRGSDLVPAREQERSRFHNEFGKRSGMGSMLGSVLFDGSEAGGLPFTNLCWYRDAGREDFRPQDVQMLKQLLPHIQRAVRMAHEIASLKYRSEVQRLVSAMPGAAWLMLDAQCHIVQTNQAADELIANGGELLKTTGKQLRQLGSRSAPSLHDAMAYCRDSGAATRLVLFWAEKNQLLKADLIPMPVDAPTGLGPFPELRYVLLLHLPADNRAEMLARIAELYGYTRAEQQVLQLLLEGHQSEQIALLRNISINTVRTQLKSILGKGGFVRQVDLVNQLSKLLD
ncbi:helix-turn-helix transcriptional regulator [Duganella sp. PWIR1]